LVCELEDLVIGAGDGVQTCESIIVDLFLEVPVSFVAEAMKEQRSKVSTLHLSHRCLVVGQVACLGRCKRGQ
jgi:hypothetical protein